MAYNILAENGIAGIEIAPGMLFPDAENKFDPSPAMIRTRLAEISDAGLVPVSMQSLLFGVEDVALFGTNTQRAGFSAALRRAIRLASKLRIGHLVLGSPHERAIPPDMPTAEARRIATNILGALADEAQTLGCRIGLEPNPAIYGTNFATHTAEAGRIVRNIGRPGLCLTLDMGALILNAEMPQIEEIAAEYGSWIGHVHISEPQLAPAPEQPETAARLIHALEKSGYAGWVSLEMRSAGEAPCATLRRALEKLTMARTLTDNYS